MANGNFLYHSDQFHSFTYSPAFYSSGLSYSQNWQLLEFYPSQTDSQQFSNQAFHPPQNDLQQFSAKSEPSAGSTSKARAKKNTREWWNPDDEKVLVQLWGENLGKLEREDSRKAWEEVTRLLNERQKTKKSVDQCQRKMKHFSHEAVAWSNHLVEHDHSNELQTTSSQDKVNAKAFCESFEFVYVF